jgi:hypothetical protein
MSQNKFTEAKARDWPTDIAGEITGVDLRELPPYTTLLVRTLNSWYRIVITQGPHGYVQGGIHFVEPTLACIGGPAMVGACLHIGWVGVGFPLRIRTADRCIATSPVCAIGTEPAAGSSAH